MPEELLLGYPRIFFPELKDLKTQYEPAILTVNIEDVKFDLFSNIQPKSPYLYVWLPGSVDRSKHELPVFQRWSWLLDIPYSGIVLNDPTLYISDLSVGWFVGKEEKYYLPLAVKLIEHIIAELNISSDKVLFLGSSAGGFAAMIMAGYLRGSSVVVNNPQTNIFKFKSEPVKKLLDNCFEDVSQDELIKHHFKRFCVDFFYNSINYVPNIYYVQNICDTLHFEDHYIPFITSINSFCLRENLEKYPSLHVDLYSMKEAGHNPLVKHRFMKYVRNAEKIYLN